MSDSPAVFIVDPDHDSRAEIARIAAEMRLAAHQYASGEEFLEAYRDGLPGCLVSEFRLLGINGIELQESLAADRIALPVIFVTAHAETKLTVRAMKNNAFTVMEKPFSEQELWDAIRKALSLDQTIRRIDAQHTKLRRQLAGLTKKERQVLDLMIEGRTNKSIAARLDVSLRTVEARRHQIFKKTRTDSIAQLVRVILQAGIQDQP